MNETQYCCRICGGDNLTNILDCGPQPLSNRFLKEAQSAEDLRPLRMGQCADCGIIQHIEVASSEDVVPRFDWITYNEPETHLDHMVSQLTKLDEVPEKCRMLGISFKDTTTMERLEKFGHPVTLLSMEEDLGIETPGAGLESIQKALTPEKARELSQKYGRFPVVIARHIYEHCHAINQFMQAMKELLTDDGILVLESPDCTQALVSLDYTTIWEEHILTLTPQSFERATTFGGFTPVWAKQYPYHGENSMVLFVKPTEKVADTSALPQKLLAQELACGKRFTQSFEETRSRVRQSLSDIVGDGKSVAMFGAGHNSCVYLNLFSLNEYISFVADDHPKKVGKFMPGSKLPIKASAALIDESISICLSSLSHESEQVVLSRVKCFKDKIVEYKSIYPSNPYSLLEDQADA